MNKVYFLNTCSTCKRILKDIDLSTFEQQEIKLDNIKKSQLAKMYNLSGSYEALFNKRSRLYTSMGLKDKKLSEKDYKKYLLEDYTFLKRPVFILKNKIFIGNDKKTVEKLKLHITKN